MPTGKPAPASRSCPMEHNPANDGSVRPHEARYASPAPTIRARTNPAPIPSDRTPTTKPFPHRSLAYFLPGRKYRTTPTVPLFPLRESTPPDWEAKTITSSCYFYYFSVRQRCLFSINKPKNSHFFLCIHHNHLFLLFNINKYSTHS